ncbi:hypothetical protein [uncultured Ruegeria sp.]|uniref:hypothetical protein n=1 Tax=uncultured Ruegeria sp. TaxID=259304 RepID=UPI002604E94E|nr:hypothetical protein [uncultured Ruegeria sp.]
MREQLRVALNLIFYQFVERPITKKVRTLKPIHRGSGATDSERYLAELADRTFLDLWSYPNTFNDNRGHKTGDGKELCDLLVVFGNDLLVFSDKSIEWKDNADEAISWKRWYKRAVKKSVQQIRGAERWLKEHPDRIFIDKACMHPLPIDLPEVEHRRVHGIAIALGAEEAGQRHFRGNDGSFVIAPAIKGDAHAPKGSEPCQPFFIGDVDPDGPFVHVFDRRGLDLVMSELDTVSDFVRYLNHRADAIRSGKVVIAENEADLLAFYLQNEDDQGGHVFLVKGERPETKYMIEGGGYERLQARPEYKAKIHANKNSGAWDKLIRLFTKTVLDGTAIAPPDFDVSARDIERALRIMAAEDRTRRRALSGAFIDALETAQSGPHIRFSRSILPAGGDAADPLCAYVFVFLPFPTDVDLERDYEQYREVRSSILATYAYAILRRNKHLKRAIGVAMEGPNSTDHREGSSEDLLMIEVEEWTQELESEIVEREQQHNVMKEGRVTYSGMSAQEYPDVSVSPSNPAVRLTRQQRRAAERLAKKGRQSWP